VNELDLKQWGVQSMNENELAAVEGGDVWNCVCDAADAVADAAVVVWNWLKAHMTVSALPSGGTVHGCYVNHEGVF
jgi:bacteriocin-like protein